MQTVISSDSATLKVYPKKGIVYHKFHKFIYGENLRKFMGEAADVFIHYNCTKWLSDDRGNSAFRQEDIEWLQANWEPKVIENYWKYWALILPDKVVGKKNMESVINRYKSMGITLEIFDDPTEAMSWLEQQ